MTFDLNNNCNSNIKELIYSNFKNDLYCCPNCGYKDGVIINKENRNYYNIINQVFHPNFIFIGFEGGNENDKDNISENIDLKYQLNLLNHKRLKSNSLYIKNMIIKNFNIYNFNYTLRAIICSPFSGHYTGLLCDLFR